MAREKIFAGARLKELRRALGLTQRDFAARLGISLPYLNQIENNNRPVSATVMLALARDFGFDVAELASGDTDRLASDLHEALAEPLIGDAAPERADVRLVAANAPTVARAVLALHRAFRAAHERLAALDEALGLDESRASLSPWEEVRDFFHYCDNYIDAVDRAAEAVGRSLTGTRADPSEAIIARLERRGITVRLAPGAQVRHFDPAARTLTLAEHASAETRRFQLLFQLALLDHDDLLEATLDFARFGADEARAIAKVGLANYFAGAALMPYGRFLEAAQAERHDLEVLARRFGASIEQVAHRLSTLQRPGARGVPFFFVRVDQAGTITKRHSATRLQFARFGGACPLWNVHRAFETPGRFLRQLARTPDGVRYFSLARDVSKPGGSFGAPVRRYAIALGCEVSHAPQLVYADGLDLSREDAFEPIGISCRICERRNCHQRSVPPLERRLNVDPHRRGVIPYEVG